MCPHSKVDGSSVLPFKNVGKVAKLRPILAATQRFSLWLRPAFGFLFEGIWVLRKPSYEVGRFRQTFAGHIYSKLRFAPLFLDWMSKYMFISGLESMLNLRFAHPGFAIKTFWIGHLSQVSPALCIY